MQVVLYRIDERLIHGQVMVAWASKTGADSVVIVDETAAKDEFMQQVYQLAAPSGIKVSVIDPAGFREKVAERGGNKAIVLFKGPAEALDTLKEGVPVGELIVGNVATAPMRTKYNRYAYLSDKEKDMLDTLQSLGWSVNMQLLPDDSKSRFNK